MTWTSPEYKIAAALAAALSAALAKALGDQAPPVIVTTQPRKDATGLSALRLELMPAAWTGAGAWRDEEADEETQIHVGIFGPGDPDKPETIDAGLALAAAVRALWTDATDDEPNPLHDLDGWTWHPPLTQAPLWHAHLASAARLFAATIAVTYQAP